MYPKNVTCITWIITVPAEHLVKLRIITFFYQSPSCKNSTLQIHDGQNSSGDAFESLCGLGKNLATLFSSGRHLWVRLQASTNDSADLYAVFKAVNQCKACVHYARIGLLHDYVSCSNFTTSRLFTRNYSQPLQVHTVYTRVFFSSLMLW